MLVHSIRDKGGKVRIMADGAIGFEGPWFTWNNWNPILFLSGVIRVDTPATDDVRVSCRLSFGRFWKMLGGSIIAMLALECVYLLSPERRILFILMPMSVAMWTGLAVFTRLISTVRAQWFLEKACARARSSPGAVGERGCAPAGAPCPPAAPAISNSSTDGSSTTRRRCKRLVALLIAIGLIMVLLAGYVFYSAMFAGVEPGPTFIEELRSEQVKTADIATVRVLKFDPGAGWPSTQDDYARKAQSTVTPRSAVVELVAMLKENTKDGQVHRNHPETMYNGILGIDLVDGRRYWLFYQVMWYEGSYCVSLISSSAGTTNPNGGKDYENAALARFLEAHDPWYQGKDSPGRRTGYRVNYPDNVP